MFPASFSRSPLFWSLQRSEPAKSQSDSLDGIKYRTWCKELIAYIILGTASSFENYYPLPLQPGDQNDQISKWKNLLTDLGHYIPFSLKMQDSDWEDAVTEKEKRKITIMLSMIRWRAKAS